jgi:glycosyltransferase A (GT-A) superfamily protein (DUF2064 family)
LGLKQWSDELFQDKQWSTNSVAEDTIKSFKLLGLNYKALETLNDLDEERDLGSFEY